MQTTLATQTDTWATTWAAGISSGVAAATARAADADYDRAAARRAAARSPEQIAVTTATNDVRQSRYDYVMACDMLRQANRATARRSWYVAAAMRDINRARRFCRRAEAAHRAAIAAAAPRFILSAAA